MPVMQIKDTLLVTLQGDLDDATVIRIEDQLTREVSRTKATGMLVDVSALAIVDSFIARVLARLVGMIRLLGAEAAVVGIQPAVAITLVELGPDGTPRYRAQRRTRIGAARPFASRPFPR